MKPWRHETNPLILRRVGKLGEENSELLKVITRIILQGYAGIDPETGKPNEQALTEEIADVMAQCQATIDYFNLDADFIERRVKEKLSWTEEWELALLEDREIEIS